MKETWIDYLEDVGETEDNIEMHLKEITYDVGWIHLAPNRDQ
jgi:hypothetical protein